MITQNRHDQPEDDRCIICASTVFWRSVHGNLYCSRCHPPDPVMVVSWGSKATIEKQRNEKPTNNKTTR